MIIDQWQTSCVFNTDLSRLTTRAWNGYGQNESRGKSGSRKVDWRPDNAAFKYLTPKLRLEEHSLNDDQLMASSFHMVCSPKRCITLVEGIRSRRSRLRAGYPRPIFVWEPVPDLCTPEELVNLQEAARYVDVVSPNGDELAKFFAEATGKTERNAMVAAVLEKVSKGDHQASIIVRDGADGSRLCLEDKTVHFRAYYQNGVGVVDPTGGGNTYLGALAIGLTRAVDPSERHLDDSLFARCTQKSIRSSSFRRQILAVLHATIAASYAIEQVGTPVLTGDQPDCWNGRRYADRFEEYIERETPYLTGQLDSIASEALQ
jgi:sugar/nucleoside kinase (ribokinase family)